MFLEKKKLNFYKNDAKVDILKFVKGNLKKI